MLCVATGVSISAYVPCAYQLNAVISSKCLNSAFQITITWVLHLPLFLTMSNKFFNILDIPHQIIIYTVMRDETYIKMLTMS